MPSQHIWTERAEDGRKREVRATKFGRKWRLQAKAAGEVDWTYYEQPLLEDLLSLKEILVRKYQRRRASVEDLSSIERLIADQTEIGSARCADRTPRHSVPTRDQLSKADVQ